MGTVNNFKRVSNCLVEVGSKDGGLNERRLESNTVPQYVSVIPASLALLHPFAPRRPATRGDPSFVGSNGILLVILLRMRATDSLSRGVVGDLTDS
jgi:hypothetical protein